MKKFFTAAALSLGLATFSHADVATLQKALTQKYPDIPTNVLAETPIKGLYSVEVDGDIIYIDQSGRYFLVGGNLLDYPNKVNLTAKQKDTINQIDIKQLPLQNAIKTVKGKGERVLYIFSDPDCPYCKKLEQELDSIDNVTLYIFLLPIKSIHPKAEQHATNIWCTNDRYQAWQSHVLQGKTVAEKTCKTPIAQNLQFAKQHKIFGTPTFFLANGQRIEGARSALEIESLLNSQK